MADDDNTRSYRSGAPFPRGGSSSQAGGQGQPQGQGGDPLAELARLIGQHDPFADLSRSAPKRGEQRQLAAPQPRDPAPEPAPPQPAQSDWRSARDTQDRYQDQQPADDYSSRDYSDSNYSNTNYSDQNYPSQDYGARQGYSDQDYRARDTRGASAHDAAYRDGYSERDYGHAPDPNYGEQDSYRAANDPHHMSGQHYDERTPFDSHGGRQAQTYGEQGYGDQGYGNFTADPQGRYDQSYAQDGADDGNYQDQRYYGQGRPAMGGDEAYDEAPRSRGRGGIITIVAVLALAMVGTAAAFAYRSYFGGGTGGAPPVIRADVGPNKVVPPQGDGPGKLQQDRFTGGSQGERVVSREEQPIPFGDGAAVRSVTPRVVPPNTGPSGLPSNATSLAPTNGTAGTDRPRPIRTVPIRNTGDQANPDPFAQQNGAAPGRGVAAAPPQRAPAPVAAPQRAPAPPPANANGPVPLNPPQADTATLPSVASRTPAPAPSRSATPPVRNATDNSGHFVQLSAQRSEDEAESSFRAMQAKFPNLLGNREAVIRRKDVSGKGTFYGAQVGPFASREEAIQLCESLKSQGGTCLYQKN